MFGARRVSAVLALGAQIVFDGPHLTSVDLRIQFDLGDVGQRLAFVLVRRGYRRVSVDVAPRRVPGAADALGDGRDDAGGAGYRLDKLRHMEPRPTHPSITAIEFLNSLLELTNNA